MGAEKESRASPVAASPPPPSPVVCDDLVVLPQQPGTLAAGQGKRGLAAVQLRPQLPQLRPCLVLPVNEGLQAAHLRGEGEGDKEGGMK